MSTEILDLYSQRPEAYDPLGGASKEQREALYRQSLFEGTQLAGREKPFVYELDAFTSEAALHRYRAEVEIEALIHLAEHGPFDVDLPNDDKVTLRTLYGQDVFDPWVPMEIDHLGRNGEKPLEHDVKAVEVYIDELLDEHGLGRLKPWVHFGMTSEDTNNLAFNLMLRDVTNQVMVPAVARVADRLAYLSNTYAQTATLGTTHAQHASPTTVGKQYGYLLSNVTQVLDELRHLRLSGKFSGAVGNHNPMIVVAPDFDYDTYARDFVESFGFDYSPIENQRNNHLRVTQLLEVAKRLSIVGKDVGQNVWLQILGNRLMQALVVGEKGSSTMAHKINPWRLENAEQLHEMAIAILNGAPEGLIASRHERDLSDHGWQRAYGDMLGRVIAGYNYMAVQLDRLFVDTTTTESLLAEHAEVLSELLQTAGRSTGNPQAYDELVRATQGKQLSLENIRALAIRFLEPGELLDRVLAIQPHEYVGIAPDLARRAVVGWHASKLILERGLLDESTSLDVVLFDFDGTLQVGDKDELQARLKEIARRLNMGFSPEQIQEFGNRSDFREMRALMITAYNQAHPETPITEDDFMQINKQVSGTLDHYFRLADDAKETLAALRATGKKTGLVTTRGSNSLPRLLKNYGIAEFFDVIINRDDATERKPHPQPLAIALERLGVTDPCRALYVGDLQTDDVIAGNALGMKTALVATGSLDAHGARPTYTFNTLEQLIKKFGRDKMGKIAVSASLASN